MTPCWFLSICPATSLFLTSGRVPNPVVIIIVQPRQVHRYDLIVFIRRNLSGSHVENPENYSLVYRFTHSPRLMENRDDGQ